MGACLAAGLFFCYTRGEGQLKFLLSLTVLKSKLTQRRLANLDCPSKALRAPPSHLMHLLVGLLAVASVADGTPLSARHAQPPSLRLRGGAAPHLSVERTVIDTPLGTRASLSPLRGGKSGLSVPKEAQLLIGALGIFLSFSTFAVLQEDVYKKAYGGEYFAFTFFAIFVERAINALTALLGDVTLGSSGLNIPYVDIFKSGVSQMFAMAASNEANIDSPLQ